MELMYQNVVEMMDRCCEEYADLPMYGAPADGDYNWMTFRDFAETVAELRGGLDLLGVGVGDRVGVISANMIPWVTMAYATFSAGAVYVPMYPQQHKEEWQYILRDSNCKVLLVASEKLYHEALTWRGEILPELQHVVLLRDSENSEVQTYESLRKMGQQHPVPAQYPDTGALVEIMYTSGTTGNPKGVMLSHRGVLSTVQAGLTSIPFRKGDRTLAFLPWAHIFGQICEVHGLMMFGMSAAMNENLAKLVDELGQVKPTLLFAVPRVYNRIYEKIHLQINNKSPKLYSLFQYGLTCSAKRRHGEKLSLKEALSFKLCDKLFFSKVRARFGNRLRMAYSGGSALNPEVIEFVQNIGITLLEGYGLTEAIVSANAPDVQKTGAVGKPLPGVRVEIDRSVTTANEQDGEIIIHGPTLMLGYHNLPEETASVFTPEGGFRTGDVGNIDEDGFLRITGRVKEIYKLENGKYCVPALMEEALKLSPFINQVMIYGFQKLYNVALIVVEVDALQTHASRNNIAGTLEDWLKDEEILKLYKQELRKYAADFQDYERPKRFHLLTEEWTVDNNLITPTLKLKRNRVEERFQEELTGMY
jgi:long-chain acyl-CoA synthetase